MKKKTLIWIFSIAAILIIVGTVGILTTRDTSTATNPTPTMVPTTEPTITPNETEPTEVPKITPTEAVTPTLVPTVPVTPTETIPTPTEEPEMIPTETPVVTETPEVIPTVAPTATSTPTPTPDVEILAPDPNEVLATAPYGDNITGVLTGDGTFTLRGSGVTYDYSKNWNMPHNRSEEYELGNYRAKVLKIVIEEGITEINGYALAFFRNCREVVLPKSLVKIGNNAFMCLGQYGYWTDSKMSGVHEKREDIFYTKINLGESNVKEIAYGAFIDTTMEAIILPETLEVIGENAFYNCEWDMWDGKHMNPVVIPASVKQIDNAAFDTGWYYIIKGKSSWDDFESIGNSRLPDENTFHKAIRNYVDITFEP